MRTYRSHALRWGLALALLLCAAAAAGAAFGYTALIAPAIMAVFCWLTAVVTRRNGPPTLAARGRALWAQLLACAVVVVAAGLDGARLNGAMPVGFQVPLWSPVHDTIRAAAALGQFGNGVANLLLYCVPVALVLLALSVPPRDLGFGRFRRGSAASAVIWMSVPVVLSVALLVDGAATASGFGALLLRNLLNNGFSEEFLFRGAILGRLRVVMHDGAALLVQAALFGLWHFGTDYVTSGGHLVGMFAEMITVQMTLGLALGYATLRTGNIAIASAFHVFFDALGSVW